MPRKKLPWNRSQRWTSELIGEVEGNHVVVVRSIMNLEDTRCFGYTESRHRLNKFKFVEFARRRKL